MHQIINPNKDRVVTVMIYHQYCHDINKVPVIIIVVMMIALNLH